MLKPAEVTRQINASTVALGKARQALADDRERPELHRTLRQEIDVLTCLIDESENAMHWKIRSLIYEFEALAGKLTN